MGSSTGVTVNPDGTVSNKTSDWMSPEGINSLLTSIGLVVGKDGTVTKTGTTGSKQADTVTETTTSPEALAFGSQIIPSLIAGIQSGDYSKAAAIKDSQGIVNQVMQNYKEMVLPQIFAGEASHGGYASTSKALLSNDAASRAAAQAAGLVADTVTKYGGIQSQQTTAAANLMSMLTNANKLRTASTLSDKTGTEQSVANTESGLINNSLFKTLGGAAGVYALLAKVLPKDALSTAFNSLKGLFPSSGPGLDSLAGLTETNYDLPSLDSLSGLTETNYDIPVEDVIGGLGTT